MRWIKVPNGWPTRHGPMPAWRSKHRRWLVRPIWNGHGCYYLIDLQNLDAEDGFVFSRHDTGDQALGLAEYLVGTGQ